MRNKISLINLHWLDQLQSVLCAGNAEYEAVLVQQFSQDLWRLPFIKELHRLLRTDFAASCQPDAQGRITAAALFALKQRFEQNLENPIFDSLSCVLIKMKMVAAIGDTYLASSRYLCSPYNQQDKVIVQEFLQQHVAISEEVQNFLVKLNSLLSEEQRMQYYDALCDVRGKSLLSGFVEPILKFLIDVNDEIVMHLFEHRQMIQQHAEQFQLYVTPLDEEHSLQLVWQDESILRFLRRIFELGEYGLVKIVQIEKQIASLKEISRQHPGMSMRDLAALENFKFDYTVQEIAKLYPTTSPAVLIALYPVASDCYTKILNPYLHTIPVGESTQFIDTLNTVDVTDDKQRKIFFQFIKSECPSVVTYFADLERRQSLLVLAGMRETQKCRLDRAQTVLPQAPIYESPARAKSARTLQPVDRNPLADITLPQLFAPESVSSPSVLGKRPLENSGDGEEPVALSPTKVVVIEASIDAVLEAQGITPSPSPLVTNSVYKQSHKYDTRQQQQQKEIQVLPAKP